MVSKFFERVFWSGWVVLIYVGIQNFITGVDVGFVAAAFAWCGLLFIWYIFDWLETFHNNRVQKRRANTYKNSVRLVKNLLNQADQEGCLVNVWSLITALRGPDVDNEIQEHLKRVYNFPIRSEFLSRDMADKLGVSDYLKYGSSYALEDYEITLDTLESRLRWLRWDDSEGHEHFLSHCRSALKVLIGSKKDD